MRKERQKIQEPVRIGNMWIKNRFVMPPMNTNYSDAHGCLTPEMEKYYIRRAQGGVGMIVLEAVSVSADSKNHGVQPMLYDEKYVPAWSNLIEQIQSYGTKVSIEIAHFGSEAVLTPRTSASGISRFHDAPVGTMTVDEIHETQTAFVKTIKNAKMAGADAVTLHGAHGYLIAEFMSPLYNHRTDEYGGCLENRMRFVTEIIAKAKVEVGKAYPIMVRYSVSEFAKGGRTVEDSVEIAKVLETAGVAAIDLTAGVPNAYIFTNPPNGLGDTSCMLIPMAEQVKKAVNIPVICANTIRRPEEIEKIINEGKADFVALGRPLLADPDYCNKFLEEKDEEIRHCLSCQHCFRTLDSGRTLRCAVNAETGREYMYGPIEKKNSKKVIVLGGGPAGMEAARICALEGHKVELYEKGNCLGGSLNAAAIPPNKEKIGWLVNWYKDQLEKLNVKIYLDSYLTEDEINGCKADAVIVAAGASYIRRIQGSDSKNVITAIDALHNPEKVGNKVVIIGGGATGCETAEFLSGEKVSITFTEVDGVYGELLYKKKISESCQNSKDISIVEMVDEIASDMDEFNKHVMHIILPEKGVHVHAATMVMNIDDGGVEVKKLSDGKKEKLEADTVILAGGLIPAPVKTGSVTAPVYHVGDSVKPGRIADALYSAYALARRI